MFDRTASHKYMQAYSEQLGIRSIHIPVYIAICDLRQTITVQCYTFPCQNLRENLLNIMMQIYIH